MTYEYRAIVQDVHDGDTITVDVDLGWNVWRRGERLRLLGINAPELYTDSGKAAQIWLARMLPRGTPVAVRTEKDKAEKYGRMLATVWDNDHDDVHGDSLNDLLVAAGHAVRWDGKGPRP
jgi:micrococcal nuclease